MRQQILELYLVDSSLDSKVIAWSFWDEYSAIIVATGFPWLATANPWVPFLAVTTQPKSFQGGIQEGLYAEYLGFFDIGFATGPQLCHAFFISELSFFNFASLE